MLFLGNEQALAHMEAAAVRFVQYQGAAVTAGTVSSGSFHRADTTLDAALSVDGFDVAGEHSITRDMPEGHNIANASTAIQHNTSYGGSYIPDAENMLNAENKDRLLFLFFEREQLHNR